VVGEPVAPEHVTKDRLSAEVQALINQTVPPSKRNPE